MVAVALANTLFFSVPTGEARGRVALYLLITMAPFAVMAPVIGPLLDRFRHGRRYAIAATMLARCFATWVLAGAVAGEELSPLPGRVRLPGLVQGLRRDPLGDRAAAAAAGRHPGRRQLADLAGRHRVRRARAGLAGLLALSGPEWSLRAAFARLRRRDGAGAAAADARSTPRSGETPHDALAGRHRPDPRRTSVGPAVVIALRANGALRAFSGFLTMFLAFLLRENPIGGLDDTAAIAHRGGLRGCGQHDRHHDRLDDCGPGRRRW